MIANSKNLAPIIIKDFRGGMNAFSEDHLLSDNEYIYAFNLRSRRGSLQTIRNSEELVDAPKGKKQGLYGFDIYLVLFCAGKAYYKIVGNNSWIKIPFFKMSSTADRMYAQAVPASTANFSRELAGDQITGATGDPAVETKPLIINGTIAGLVVQDGESQPWIITADGSARELQSYTDWTLDTREYVPVGKQMAYINDILFVISPDGKLIFRSVLGRPIDFVINILQDGNAGGDASTTAHAVSYNTITNINPLNTGELLVGTDKGIFPVELDFQNLLFDQPRLKNKPLIASGITNQFALVDMLGDYAFIDNGGIRSFNAVKQLQVEGKNSIFSLKVASLFENITQQPLLSCAENFMNYSLFAVNTIFGYVLLVYDQLSSTWVSIDTLSIGAIKQIAVNDKYDEQKIYCITNDDKIYQLYSLNADYAEASLYSKAIASEDSAAEVKLDIVRTVFARNDSDTEITVTEYANNKRGSSLEKTIPAISNGITFPIKFPVAFDSGSSIRNIKFDFSQLNLSGFKVSAIISWKSSASLLQLQLEPSITTVDTSTEDTEMPYAS